MYACAVFLGFNADFLKGPQIAIVIIATIIEGNHFFLTPAGDLIASPENDKTENSHFFSFFQIRLRPGISNHRFSSVLMLNFENATAMSKFKAIVKQQNHSSTHDHSYSFRRFPNLALKHVKIGHKYNEA